MTSRKTRRDTPITGRLRQLLIGSLLGDGNIPKPTSTKGVCFRESHAANQESYLRWKAEMWGDLVTPAGVVFHDRIKPTRQDFYSFTTTSLSALLPVACAAMWWRFLTLSRRLEMSEKSDHTWVWVILSILFSIFALFHFISAGMGMKQEELDQRCATVCSAENGKVTEGVVRGDKCYCLKRLEQEWKP